MNNSSSTDHQAASGIASAVEDVLISRPWAMSEAGYNNARGTLPAGHPALRLERRNAVAQAIADGQAVPASIAAEYPDIVQAASMEGLPEWALARLRSRDPVGAGRYVFTLEEVFYVKPVKYKGEIDYLVTRAGDPVEERTQLDAIIEGYERDSAINMYLLVEKFIADPTSCAKEVAEVLSNPAPARRASFVPGRRRGMPS